MKILIILINIIWRLKILLWFPFVILFFPLMVILGKDKTEEIGDFILDN